MNGIECFQIGCCGFVILSRAVSSRTPLLQWLHSLTLRGMVYLIVGRWTNFVSHRKEAMELEGNKTDDILTYVGGGVRCAIQAEGINSFGYSL